MRKPSKITDKERMDWLTRHRGIDLDLTSQSGGWAIWTPAYSGVRHPTPRAAIDAAIKKERALRAERKERHK